MHAGSSCLYEATEYATSITACAASKKNSTAIASGRVFTVQPPQWEHQHPQPANGNSTAHRAAEPTNAATHATTTPAECNNTYNVISAVTYAPATLTK